jgi:hypothetical protein
MPNHVLIQDVSVGTRGLRDHRMVGVSVKITASSAHRPRDLGTFVSVTTAIFPKFILVVS